jgi:hypothetical protein
MELALRHTWSIVLVLIAAAGTVAVFTFARPVHHRQYESKMIDFSQQHYYSPKLVRQAFAQQGIHLHTSMAFEFTVLSTTRRLQADDLQVIVGPRTGKGSFGPKLEPYDKRFGNVLVTYGGRNAALIERVKAAVSALGSA